MRRRGERGVEVECFPPQSVVVAFHWTLKSRVALARSKAPLSRKSPCRSEHRVQKSTCWSRAQQKRGVPGPRRGGQRKIERGRACSLFPCASSQGKSSHGELEGARYLSRALHGRALVVLLASRAPGTRTHSLREPAHAKGGFEAPVWERSGAASRRCRSVARWQAKGKEKKPTLLIASHSRARRPRSHDAPSRARRASRLSSRPSRARFFGQNRRRTRGKGASARLFPRGKEKKNHSRSAGKEAAPKKGKEEEKPTSPPPPQSRRQQSKLRAGHSFRVNSDNLPDPTWPPMTTMEGSMSHRLGRLLSPPATSPSVVAAAWRRLTSVRTDCIPSDAILGGI